MSATLDLTKILITFYQVLASLSYVHLSWPKELKNLMKILSAIKINILQLPSVPCALQQFTYHHKLLFYSLAPFLVFGLLAVPTSVPHFRHIDTKIKNELVGTFSRSVYFLLFLLYPIVSEVVIGLFKCNSYNMEINDPPYWTQRSFLHLDHRCYPWNAITIVILHDPSLHCRIDCDGAAYKGYYIFGCFAVCVWPVGVLVFFLGLLFWYEVQMARD